MKKTALVTGSSKGIGKAIVLALAEQGYDVAINCSGSLAAALETQKECEQFGVKAIVIVASVATSEGRQKLYDEFFAAYDHIDLLVNNAGITRMVPFLETSEELFDEVINLDFRGSYFLSQKFAQSMVDGKVEGCIVNITSIHQEIQFPFASVYGPCKAALGKLTKHMALELARHKIRVVTVAPGCTINEPERRTLPRTIQLGERIPMKRWGEGSEIADAIVFLASEKAAYITGVTLPVEGGVMLPPYIDSEEYYKD